MSMDWRHRGACGGTDLRLWFGPEVETPEARITREAQAKAICGPCPVRLRCLNFAVREPVPWGIWGGLSEDERALARRRWLRFQKQVAA